MAFDKTLRVVQPGQRRLKIFVDFWNVVINARSQTKFNIDVNWTKLSKLILSETRQGHSDESSGEIAGCYIFGSYAKNESSSILFIEKVLDEYGSSSGMYFDFKERIKKETSHQCPTCKSKVPRSSESGVDVLLTVEIIKHAAMKGHDYLSLVSSDRDYIPILQYMKDQGQRVVHVAPGEAHREMRAATWKQVAIKDSYPYISKIINEKILILTEPNQAKHLQDITEILSRKNIDYDTVDITSKEQISDRDLVFINENQGLYFNKINSYGGTSYSIKSISKNTYEFRRDLAQGIIRGNLPCAIVDGKTEIHRNSDSGWFTNGYSKFDEIWGELKQKHRNTSGDF